MSPIRGMMGGRRIATPTTTTMKADADGVAVTGKKGANMSGASTRTGEAAVGTDATGATDRQAAWLSNITGVWKPLVQKCTPRVAKIFSRVGRKDFCGNE